MPNNKNSNPRKKAPQINAPLNAIQAALPKSHDTPRAVHDCTWEYQAISIIPITKTNPIKISIHLFISFKSIMHLKRYLFFILYINRIVSNEFEALKLFKYKLFIYIL
nr:hypothetical protein [uncultured archaeon]